MSLNYDTVFIGGTWQAPASAKIIESINPSTEQINGQVPEAIEADIDNAVSAARSAFDDPSVWSGWTPAERAADMRKLADEIDARADDFQDRVSSQNGMPVSVAAQLEIGYPSAILRYYADLIEKDDFTDVRSGMFGGEIEVRRQPIGVVAAIVPWNFPQALTMFKLAPALAAGCTMVIKPSDRKSVV